MRKIFLSLVLCALAFVPVSARARLVASDNLIRNDHTLGSSWTATVACAITDWVLSFTAPSGASPDCTGADFNVSYYTGTFANNQYSQVVIVKGTNGYEGVVVRASSGNNGYGVTLDGGSGCTIYKWVSGTRTSIGSCTVTWTDGHTLYLESVGTTLTVKDNGSTIGTATSQTDLSSGSPGITGYQDSPGKLTFWEGGDIGGATSFVPGIINAPIRGGGWALPRPR